MRRADDAAPGRRQSEVDALIEAGFDDESALRIAARWAFEQLSLLALRDQARREQWLDSERYRDSVKALTRGPDSLRGTLDLDEYERLVGATELDSRLTVRGVLAGSPANAAGILPGDLLLRYGELPIHSLDDVALVQGLLAPGDEVELEVARAGEVLTYSMPAGPLGVRLEVPSVSSFR